VRTIRARLTLAYGALLIAIVLLLGIGLYVALAHALSQEASDSAQRLAEQAARLVSQSTEGDARAIDEVDATLAETLARGDLYLEIRNPDGRVASRSPALVERSIVPAAYGPASAPLTYAAVLPKLGPVVAHVIAVSGRGKFRGIVAAARNLSEVERTLGNLRTILIAASLFAIVVGGGSGWWLAGVALRPVDQITRAANSISAGALSQRLALHGPDDELHRLAATFDRMLDRLQNAFERERRFTADVAHELKTPLTILQGEIDVTLRRPRDEVEYRARLGSLHDEVKRLSSLVDGLLSMARADAGVEVFDRSLVHLAPLIQAVVANFASLAERRDVSICVAEADDVTANVDADRLRQALYNLLDNAVRHSNLGGTVTIALRAAPGDVVIEVADNGPGIDPRDLPFIFDRFYRIDAHRARSVGGTGLGLAITKWIVEGHGGTIEGISDPGRRTAFVIRLPADGGGNG
jgi:two-component system OmpR family sensor kinase